MLPTVKSRDTSIFSENHMSQWENLMKKYSRAHEEECKQTILKMPLARRSTKYFPTGSNYTGSWNVLGMSGYGVYTYKNGVIYEGDFEDGMFHGVGQFRYPDGTIVRGHFNKGVMIQRKLIFSDALVYEEEYWSYCKMPDRRYTTEYKGGIPPAGRSNITAIMPPRKIPPGFYDTGDGVFDPITKSVYKADDLSTVLRSPSVREQEWIIANCRKAPETVLGPRSDLYEEWSVPQLVLPRPPPPAADTQVLPLARSSSHQRRISINVDDTSEYWGMENYACRESMGFKPESAATIPLDDEASRASMLHSNTQSDIKNYTKRLTKGESHLRFSTLPSNYSELFSQNIDTVLVAVFQKATDTVMKYSHVYDSKNTNDTPEKTIREKSMKDIPESKTPNRNRDINFKPSPTPRELSDMSSDSDDMLPSQNKVSLDNIKVLAKKSQSFLKKKQEYGGLTSSVIMFDNVENAKANKLSKKLSDRSGGQINNQEATRNTILQFIYKLQ